MVVEKTFVMIKPDGVQRGIIGELITRFEKVGLKIIGMKFIHIDSNFSKKHYSEHVDKLFYPSLENLLISGPVLAMVLEGAKSIELVRKMVGSTEPAGSAPGTIRGDYSHMNYARANGKGIALSNLIHASDSSESAKKEIQLWFSKSELFDNYELAHAKFM